MARKAISEAEVRQALLSAATASFLEKGIMATEMKEIAERSGLSRSTLYRYTISKNQLAFLVGEQQLRLIAEAALVQPVPMPATGWERLDHYCTSLLDLLESRVNVLRLMIEFDAIYAGPYPDIPEARDYVVTMQRIHNATLQLVLDGLADHSMDPMPDPGLFASVLENVIFGMATRFFPREAHYMEEHSSGGRQVITEIIRRLLDGVHVKEA